MNDVDASLLYLLVSRSIFSTAGIVCMVLGYKLLCRGVGLTQKGGQVSTIESSMAGAKLTVKNAAPGTAFALFGAILIIVMLVQSSPSVTMETLLKSKRNSEERSEDPTMSRKFIGRGGDPNSMLALTLAGQEFDSQGDTANAERNYREAVHQMAEPINDLAWLYYKGGRIKDAAGLARLAVQMSPDEPRYADTLSKASATAR